MLKPLKILKIYLKKLKIIMTSETPLMYLPFACTEGCHHITRKITVKHLHSGEEGEGWMVPKQLWPICPGLSPLG